MRLLGLLATAVLVVACSSAAAPAQAGNPAVYQRIASETNCATLQREFDTALENFNRATKGTAASAAAIDYMNAAYARMRAVGCY